MYRKIYIAVDCDSDAQRDQVQAVAEEISNLRLLSGEKILQVWPFIRAHEADIRRLFSMITSGGVKSVVSPAGIQIITKLMRR